MNVWVTRSLSLPEVVSVSLAAPKLLGRCIKLNAKNVIDEVGPSVL